MNFNKGDKVVVIIDPNSFSNRKRLKHTVKGEICKLSPSPNKIVYSVVVDHKDAMKAGITLDGDEKINDGMIMINAMSYHIQPDIS